MKKSVQKLLQQAPLQLLLIAFIFLLSIFTFSLIVDEAVFGQEDVFDTKVIQFFAAHSYPALTEAMKRITFFGSSTFLFPAYIVLIAWLLFRKKVQYAADIAIIALSSTGMMFLLKQFFHRHRPPLPVIKALTSYSFPSGHALSSFIFCTILMYLVWKGSLPKAGKYVLIVLLFLCTLTIGLSRVILNVHYATDVIGGFCTAIIWVIISFAILKKLRKNTGGVKSNAVS